MKKKNKFKKQYQFDKDIFKNSEGKIGIVVTNEKEFDTLIEKLSNYGFTYEYGETLLGSSYKETFITTGLYHLPTHLSFISLDGDIFFTTSHDKQCKHYKFSKLVFK